MEGRPRSQIRVAGRKKRPTPRPLSQAFLSKLGALVVVMTFASSSCGGSSSATARPTPVGDVGAAWATLAREVTHTIAAAFESGKLNACDSCGLFRGAADPSLDPLASDAETALNIVCSSAREDLNPGPQSQQIARGCGIAQDALTSNAKREPPDAMASLASFDEAGQAFLAAGAADDPREISDRMRRNVLGRTLNAILAGYMKSGGAIEAAHAQIQLGYVCPAMFSDGDASTDNCSRLASALRHRADDHLETSSSKDVQVILDPIVTELSKDATR